MLSDLIAIYLVLTYIAGLYLLLRADRELSQTDEEWVQYSPLAKAGSLTFTFIIFPILVPWLVLKRALK